MADAEAMAEQQDEGMAEGLAAHTKQQLRRGFRQRRRQALERAAAGLIRQLSQHLPPLLAGEGRLGIYWPLEGEIDLLAALAEPPFQGQRLALPAIEDGVLHYRSWDPSTPLDPDACGIPAPPSSAGNLDPRALQLLLVPALAIDPAGVRLGYGGGWYDRLRSDPAWRRIPALAVLPAACLSPGLPRDPWDIPLDGWISEAGLGWANPGPESRRGQLRDKA